MIIDLTRDSATPRQEYTISKEDLGFPSIKSRSQVSKDANRKGWLNDTSMRMEQYLIYTDYSLWEVIVNGDAPAIASASASTEGPIPPKIAE
ncbi:hypothetical protein Tco_0670247 [Tanacetum coccineum]